MLVPETGVMETEIATNGYLIDRILGPKTSHLVHQSSLSRDILSETEPIVTWPFTFGWSLEKNYSVLARYAGRYAPH